MDNKKILKKNEFKSLSLLLHIIKPQIIAYLITAIIFIAIAILLTYTDFDENKIPFISLICTAISSLIAGFDTASNFGRKGFLWGAISGVLYSLILFIICLFASSEFSFNLGKLILLIISISAGIIGGVLGVNRNVKR